MQQAEAAVTTLERMSTVQILKEIKDAMRDMRRAKSAQVHSHGVGLGGYLEAVGEQEIRLAEEYAFVQSALTADENCNKDLPVHYTLEDGRRVKYELSVVTTARRMLDTERRLSDVEDRVGGLEAL